MIRNYFSVLQKSHGSNPAVSEVIEGAEHFYGELTLSVGDMLGYASPALWLELPTGDPGQADTTDVVFEWPWRQDRLLQMSFNRHGVSWMKSKFISEENRIDGEEGSLSLPIIPAQVRDLFFWYLRIQP